jgi:hypothetical protein
MLTVICGTFISFLNVCTFLYIYGPVSILMLILFGLHFVISRTYFRSPFLLAYYYVFFISGMPYISYGRGKGRFTLDDNDKISEYATFWKLSSFRET